MENKPIQLEPIPQQEHFVCITCGSTAISTVGNQVLCQNCINQFLARNVGLMRPVREIQAEQEAAQKAVELEKAKAKPKKKAPRKKAAVKKGGTG